MWYSFFRNIIIKLIKKYIAYISDTYALILQRLTPRTHGYCCQNRLSSLGNPESECQTKHDNNRKNCRWQSID